MAHTARIAALRHQLQGMATLLDKSNFMSTQVGFSMCVAKEGGGVSMPSSTRTCAMLESPHCYSVGADHNDAEHGCFDCTCGQPKSP